MAELVGDTTSVPLVGSAPVQLPLAVHEVALLLDQVNVDVLPELIVEGLAVMETAVPGRTVTVALAGVEPPVPAHVSV